jgi:predicted phosphodiesterase
MFTLFPEADCIVYGHTHRAVCHTVGTTLVINPGSFQSTGHYGAQGTYALLKITDNGLHGAIHELPRTS